MFVVLDKKMVGGEWTTTELTRRSRDRTMDMAEAMVKDPKVEAFDLMAWETKAAMEADEFSVYGAHKCRDCVFY